MATPAEADLGRLAKEDALDAIEYARQPERQRWPVTSLNDPTDRGGWPQTLLHRRSWQQREEGWPEPLRAAYRSALMAALTEANFALVEQRHADPGREWTNVAVVDLERWEPTFPFTPGKWVQQDYGSSAGWRRRSLWRRLRSR